MAAMHGTGADHRLFVTKIPQTVTKEAVAAHFEQFGECTDVYMPFVPGHQGHKGIAFISYGEARSMQVAMGSAPHVISGSEVVVDVAAPRGQPPNPLVPSLPGQTPRPRPGQSLTGAGEGGGDRLFITKVPPNLTKDHLSAHFQQFGELTDCYMPAAPGSGHHKGIGFIAFADPAACQAALQHGASHEIEGHSVVVDIAAPRGPAGGAPAPAFGGSFGGAAFGGPAFGSAAFGGAAFGGGAFGGKGARGGLALARPVPHFSAAQAWAGAAQYAASQYANVFATPSLGFGGFAGFPGIVPVAATPSSNGEGVPVAGRLFVTKVAHDISKADLEMYFSQFGALNDLFMPSGGKGIAFVSFEDPAVAQRVLSSPTHLVKQGQNPVVVDQAVDRPALPVYSGGRGFGGYGGYGGGRRFASPY